MNKPPSGSIAITVQTDMSKRSKGVRLMEKSKRYECGWWSVSNKGESLFTKVFEVGDYAAAKKEWLDET